MADQNFLLLGVDPLKELARIQSMSTMNRRQFGIRSTTQFMLVPIAKEPVRFSYMTASDVVVPVGASLLNYYSGPKQFTSLENAERAKATLEWRGMLRSTEVSCNFESSPWRSI
jgi:hypothetical protein